MDVHLAGLDLGQVEHVVDQRQEVGAGGVDGRRELDLLLAQVALRVVGQQARQDQQAVERRPQLVRHVGQELALVARRQGELARLLLQVEPRGLDGLVLLLDLAVLAAQQLRLLLELLVRLLQLLLLGLQELLGRLQALRLLLQLGVGALEGVLLLLQGLGLALQLGGQELRLPEQLLRAHRRDDRVEHDADGLRELLQEGGVHLREAARRSRARSPPAPRPRTAPAARSR